MKNLNNKNNYSGRLKHILYVKGYSRSEFAKAIGLNYSGTVDKIISDNRKPSRKTVERIITAFPDISEKWLLFGIEDKKETSQDEMTVTAKQVIDFIKFEIPKHIDQRDNQTASILMDKLNDMSDFFQNRIEDVDERFDANENELQKLQQTVFIMHKNNVEQSKNIDYLVQQLNVYLKEKLK
jgi:transcriptional regulator with XRE-family HTH domain